jgi:hypothetical protein
MPFIKYCIIIVPILIMVITLPSIIIPLSTVLLDYQKDLNSGILDLYVDNKIIYENQFLSDISCSQLITEFYAKYSKSNNITSTQTVITPYPLNNNQKLINPNILTYNILLQIFLLLLFIIVYLNYKFKSIASDTIYFLIFGAFITYIALYYVLILPSLKNIDVFYTTGFPNGGMIFGQDSNYTHTFITNCTSTTNCFDIISNNIYYYSIFKVTTNNWQGPNSLYVPMIMFPLIYILMFLGTFITYCYCHYYKIKEKERLINNNLVL